MTREIINTYDQMKAAGGKRVAICYQAQDTGRGGRSAGWYVVRLVDGEERQTDPNAHWRDYSHKFFLIGLRPGTFHEQKKAALEEAIAWTNQKYGTREFVRNRLGNYVEKEVNEQFPIRRRVK